MPAAQLSRNFASKERLQQNPLPNLLQTPLGLAILEIQGTIHAPNGNDADSRDQDDGFLQTVDVGQLEFPLYDGSSSEGPWMKRVYLYVGKHQRLTGEVKKLAKPLLVLSKDDAQQNGTAEGQSGVSQSVDQLGIDAVIKHKILFSSRPEPVTK